MRVFFHDYAIESHRSPKRVAEFVAALERAGIQAVKSVDSECIVAFCGAFETARYFATDVTQENARRVNAGLRPLKTCYYNWDLYPFQMNGRDPRWPLYAKDISTADLILVPSYPVVVRTRQYCQRESTVVLSSCNSFDHDQEIPEVGEHVLDVMRVYRGDRGTGATKQICDRMQLACIESKCRLSEDEFRKAIINARVLVSVYDEASTGGLTLMEGYRLGKPVVITDAPLNGAKEYFEGAPGRVHIVNHNSLLPSLRQAIRAAWLSAEDESTRITGQEKLDMKQWIDSKYSDDAFAQRLAVEFRRIVQ